MLEAIIEKISEASGLTPAAIKKMVDEKCTELSELISEEGAAYIVAKELGIEVNTKDSVKISSIPENARVDLTAKVVGITDREFSTPKASGKVRNVLLADETGTIRLALWNEEIEKYRIEKGDVVNIRGFSKEGLRGRELRIGRYGLIDKTDEKIETIPIKNERLYERKSISELSEGYAEIRAAIVHIFESPPFFQTCANCGKKGCAEHNAPQSALVISGIVDDGTGNIRAVFFRENAEKMLGIDTEKAQELFISGSLFKIMPVGKEFVLRGRCKKNKIFERNEFVVDEIRDVDVTSEIEYLL